MKNKLELSIVILALAGFAFACSSAGERTSQIATPHAYMDVPEKLESYEVRGLQFVYYRIPSGLGREDLIKTTAAIHKMEGDAQIILVDDDSGLADYISYTKAVSSGNYNVDLPAEWASRHIIANVQRYTSGKFVLCEGYGYKEIAELE